MTESVAKTPEGMHTITPHIVVRDATAATDWYKQVLGAEERSRIEVPGGKLICVAERDRPSASWRSRYAGGDQNAFATEFHSWRRCAMSWARSSSLPPSSTWRSEGSARR
jgi:catechol 2,3-dioxygenase-like lactoylglutathione lyase family enzyme